MSEDSNRTEPQAEAPISPQEPTVPQRIADGKSKKLHWTQKLWIKIKNRLL